MSHYLLLGLSPHDAAAIELLISRSDPQQRCIVLPRSSDFSLPTLSPAARQCRWVIADLAGLGLSQPSPEHGTSLRHLLADRPALLLLRGSASAWADSAWHMQHPSPILYQTAPYRSADIHAATQALQQASQANQPSSAPTSAPATTPTPRPQAEGRTGSRLQLLQAMPNLARHPLLHALATLPRTGCTKIELDGAQLHLQPERGISHSSLPPQGLLQALALQAERLKVAKIGHSPTCAAGERRHAAPLDVTLWELSQLALHDITLEAPQQPLILKLARFPNFTLLGKAPPVFVQLATQCVHSAQPLHQLLRKHQQASQEVLRFVALCVLSGIGQLQPHSEAAPASPTAPSRDTPASSPAKTSFFKALLSKLF